MCRKSTVYRGQAATHRPVTSLTTEAHRSYHQNVVRAGIAALVIAAALAGCTDQLVDVPTSRPPATVVALEDGGQCPPDTVLLADDEQGSGAGAIPADFVGRLVLRCDVDNSSATTRAGVERVTVRQWQAPSTPELEASFALPDRDFRRGGQACGASGAGTTAVYLVDRAGRAARILLPTQEPCQDIRDEVEALLPGANPSANKTFQAKQPAR